MALQPTKRGAWCRADRKKSYRLGDLSVLIGRLTKDGSAIAELVGGRRTPSLTLTLTLALTTDPDPNPNPNPNPNQVGGGLRGADRGERTWVARLAVPGASYVIVPLCLGNNPTAAETSQRQTFSVRLWSSEPVLVRQTTSYPPAQVGRSARTVSWCGEIALQVPRPSSE